MSEYQATIILPAFNEEEAIGAVMEKLTRDDNFKKFEIIVVDDGSEDSTCEIVLKFPVKLLRHHVNKGYGAALKTGIRKAKSDKVLMMDTDGQHNPDQLLKIIEMLEEFDMVIGERSAGSFQVNNRKFGKTIIRKVGEYLVEQPLPDYNSGYRGFSRDLILSMLHIMPNGFSFSTTSTLAFLKEGYSIGIFPIEVTERTGRASNVKFFKDGSKTILLLFRIIMLFNPLKVFFPASLITFIAGFAFGTYGYIAFSRFSNGGMLLMILGMLLFFFGLLADQIAIMNRKKH